MKIAILAWGSLLYDANGLSLASDWQTDTLQLPLEFSRVSSKGEREGCLTLVIDEQNGQDCPVFFAESALDNLNDAIRELAERERVSYMSSIGYVNLKHGRFNTYAMRWYPLVCERIIEWAREKEFDAVIWANFKPNFEEITETEFTLENGMQHLNALPEPQKARAFQYIQNANEVINTPLRQEVNRVLREGREVARAGRRGFRRASR